MLISVKRKVPANWASALVNRDASGLTPDEAEKAFAWEREQGFGEAVSAEDHTYIESFQGFTTETCSYAFLVKVPIDEVVVPAYLEAAMFTDGGPDHPDIDAGEFAPESILKAKTDCVQFISDNIDLVLAAVSRVGYDYASLAHDLWLTRNGHGTGFWDRRELEEGDLGNQLSMAARALPPLTLELDDKGNLHLL